MKRILFFLVMISGLFLLAETIYVPDDYPAIQEAINISEDGDEIIISPGTYQENLNIHCKAITLASLYYTTQDTSYISQTVIDGNHFDSVINIGNIDNGSIILCGLTLTNGHGHSGGGLIANNANLILDQLYIHNCQALQYGGGGIRIDDASSLLMSNLVITSNSAALYGGGIILMDCDNVILSDSEITDNSSNSMGGGIVFYNSPAYLENVHISNNSSLIYGGGMFSQYCSQVEMHNCTIDNNILNYSESFGGGYFSFEDEYVMIENSVVSYNTAAFAGGINIRGWNDCVVDINNVLISHNGSTLSGGGISILRSEVNITNSEIEGNRSNEGGGLFIFLSQDFFLGNVLIQGNKVTKSGGGIAMYNSYGLLENVTIKENQAERGGAIFFSNSNPLFSTENPCNIYSNNCNLRGNGSELFSLEPVSIYIDTFTVQQPSSYHVTDLSSFDITIQTGLIEQIDADLYVSPTGDNSNSGLTEDEPFKNINFACCRLLPLENEQRTIHLANGIYSYQNNEEIFPVSLPDNVILRGENQQNTILDAQDVGNVMTFYQSNNNAVIDLTIQGGLDNMGGGVYVEDSSPIFQKVTIKDNSSSIYGGGIFCDGISSPSFEYVTFTDNSSVYGGAVYCSLSSDPHFNNVTMVNNEAVYGGGMFCTNDNYPVIINSILWNNEPEHIYFSNHDGFYNTVTVIFSDIENGLEDIITNSNGSVFWLEGNIDQNPVFTDPENDFTLTENSPCIDTGIAYFEYEGEVLVDMDESEYIGTAPDMGAWEYYPVDSEEECIPNTGLTLNNYPNPFNPITYLVFNLPKAEHVKLAVYNLKGQRVKMLVDEVLEAGENRIIWDGRNETGQPVGSGVYLVQLRSEKANVIKKIMLMK